jgi:hypothetical protein
VSSRWPPGTREAELNDQKGTLEAVYRKRATVDFGGTRWNFPLKNLQPTGREQGRFILF